MQINHQYKYGRLKMQQLGSVGNMITLYQCAYQFQLAASALANPLQNRRPDVPSPPNGSAPSYFARIADVGLFDGGSERIRPTV